MVHTRDTRDFHTQILPRKSSCGRLKDLMPIGINRDPNGTNRIRSRTITITSTFRA